MKRCCTSSIPMRSSRTRWAMAVAAMALLGCALLSLCVGAVALSPGQVWQALTGRATGAVRQICLLVRLPRTIAAVLAGAALSVSGLILQTVLNNALAGPNIIGVNAGAGLFTLLLAAFFPSLLLFTPLAAMLGALVATLLIYFIASATGASRMTLVLAGIAISSFLGAMTDTVLTLVPEAQTSRMSFMIGGLSGVYMRQMLPAMAVIAAGMLLAFVLRKQMNVLMLGDEVATSLGLRTRAVRFALLLAAAMLAGGAVSFAGLLGFIGLIVPHAARFLIGYDQKALVPLCALLGAAFTLLCDLLSRVLFAPYEIPVGIVLSFIGGPFFLMLLLRQKRGRLYD